MIQNTLNIRIQAREKESGKNCLLQKRLSAHNVHLPEFRQEPMFYLTGEHFSFSIKGRNGRT